jgi:transcription elongation factor Elf1
MTTRETTSTTDEIACPHCGATQRALGDIGWDDPEPGVSEMSESALVQCGGCELSFCLTRYVSVTYTARAR